MVENNKKILVLLDAHAIIHRAYHALPDFTSSEGKPTGALYGVSSMLLKLIKELKPDYIISCYDLPEPTFRHKVYKDYKKGRRKADDDLVSQIKDSYKIFKAFGIPVCEASGFEADDIIGTLSDKAKKEKNINVIIASGDMDTLQLVDKKRVQVFTFKKGITDTILYDEEAVKKRFGFGPKLLPDYKGLRGDPSDNIIGIKGIGDKTATHLIIEFGTIENIYKALKKDRDLFLRKGFKERIIKLLEEGKEEALFSKVLAQIRLDSPIDFNLEKSAWDSKFNTENITNLFNKFGFRTLVGRFKNQFPDDKKEIDKKEKENISEEEIKKIGIALWILNSSQTNPSKEDILLYTNKKLWEDAKTSILAQLKKEKLEHIYTDIEIPLIPILSQMEERGILIDTNHTKKISKEFHTILSKLEKDIWKDAGEEFNINSPKQLGEILFDKLQLFTEKIKKTKGGAKSTRQNVLEELQDKHPIIEKLLSYRELQKLLSTYIDNIFEMVDRQNRLHTQFVQTGTVTGRMSSKNPNIQNIPIKGKYGKTIREMFIAGSGYMLVSFDYSQIELRVAALLSGDKQLTNILKNGYDVHSATAGLLFNVTTENVTKNMRRIAKIINFGIIYGMGINALRQTIGASREEAQNFYENYFKTFNGLSKYLEKIKIEAKKKGYTETLYGRRRYFPGLKSNIPYIVSQEERQAVNAPIQGTNADIIKIAMIRIYKRLIEKKLLDNVHSLLQIHDELIFEIKKENLKEGIELIKKEMEEIIDNEIPFIVITKIGYNWGNMKNYKYE